MPLYLQQLLLDMWFNETRAIFQSSFQNGNSSIEAGFPHAVRCCMSDVSFILMHYSKVSDCITHLSIQSFKCCRVCNHLV